MRRSRVQVTFLQCSQNNLSIISLYLLSCMYNYSIAGSVSMHCLYNCVNYCRSNIKSSNKSISVPLLLLLILPCQCVYVYNAARMTYEVLEFFQLAYPQLRYSYSRLNINAFSVAIEAVSYSIKLFSSQRFDPWQNKLNVLYTICCSRLSRTIVEY